MKALIKSKIFWLQILAFVSTSIEGFTKVKIDPATLQQIVELDWSNILVASISAATIIARVYFTSVPINGLIKPGGTVGDSFTVQKMVIFAIFCSIAMSSCARSSYGCTVPCNDAAMTVRYGFLAYTNGSETTFTKIIFDSTYVKDADKSWIVFKNGMTITGTKKE